MLPPQPPPPASLNGFCQVSKHVFTCSPVLHLDYRSAVQETAQAESGSTDKRAARWPPGSRTGCCTVPAHRCEWPEEKPQRRPRRQAPSPGPGSASEVPCPPGKWQFKALTKWGQLLPKKTIRLCSPQVGPTCAQALNARLFPVLFIRGTVPLLFFSHLHAPRTAAWPATGRPLSSFMNHTRACATHVNPTASSKKDRNPLEGPTPNANHCVRHCAGTSPCPQDH